MALKNYTASGCLIILLAIAFSFTGCKSKDREQQEQDDSGFVSDDQVRQLRDENEQLKAKIEKTRQQQPQSPAAQPESDYSGQREVYDIMEQYAAATTSDEKIDLLGRLETLAFNNDREVLAVIEISLVDPNEQVNRAGAALLENYESPAALAAIEKALYNSDVQTRVSAARSLANIKDPRTAELITTALNDESNDVREEAFSALDEQSQSVQLRVIETAIRLPYEDVKTYAVDALEDIGNHQAVDVLIQGLKDPDPVFREQVNQSLDFLIEEQFDSYEQAAAWWNENRDKYDSDLFLKDEWFDEDED